MCGTTHDLFSSAIISMTSSYLTSFPDLGISTHHEAMGSESLTEQVHDRADARAQIILHIAEAAPEHGEYPRQFFGQSIYEMRRNR